MSHNFGALNLSLSLGRKVMEITNFLMVFLVLCVLASLPIGGFQWPGVVVAGGMGF